MTWPRARDEGVLTTELDDELIVYDSERKWAHSLNPTAASVWRHCDGRHSISDLQRDVSAALGSLVDEGAIALALQQLDQAHLLLDGFQLTGQSVSRREMLRNARRVGVAAVAAPVVFSALVRDAAAAASCNPTLVAGSPCNTINLICCPPLVCSSTSNTCV